MHNTWYQCHMAACAAHTTAYSTHLLTAQKQQHTSYTSTTMWASYTITTMWGACAPQHPTPALRCEGHVPPSILHQYYGVRGMCPTASYTSTTMWGACAPQHPTPALRCEGHVPNSILHQHYGVRGMCPTASCFMEFNVPPTPKRIWRREQTASYTSTTVWGTCPPLPPPSPNIWETERFHVLRPVNREGSYPLI